ncbi:hypothetical protein [Psychrobacillus antarcticus]|uniref:hypothetical protein n=1 Tax=Psychrobacillus antarcticus TaxID=2879115 RepID=UPI0024085707|nr:hypothetical protein [Psychrobacillus antarcticus]
MRHHSDAQATVMAHRSPRGTRPPETEISSIIHSFKSHESSVHGTFLYTFLSFKKEALWKLP